MSVNMEYSSSEETYKNNINAKKEYTEISTQKNDTGVFKDNFIKDDNVIIPNTEDLLYDKKTKWNDHIGILLISLLISFGGFLYGWDLGYVGGLLGMSNFKQYFGTYDASNNTYYFSNAKTGAIVAMFTFGGSFGGIILSDLPNIYGRKIALAAVTGIYIIGNLIQITCVKHKHAWIQLIIGRLIAGFGYGGVASTAPLLLGETAPAKLRSICVSFYQLSVTLGVFLGKCTNYATRNYADSNSGQWRVQVGLCFLWALLLITGIAFVPESARYYVQQDRIEDARKTLSILNNVPGDDPLLQRELETLIYAIEAEKIVKSDGVKDLFSTKNKIIQRMANGIILQSCQQLTGSIYFLYYGTLVFKAVGLKNSYVTSIIIGFVNFGSTFFTFFFVHKWGRRGVLLVGAIVMFICMLIYACVGSQKLYLHGTSGPTSKQAGNVMIAFTCISIFTYSTTWAPLTFVVCSESYPLSIRSLCMSINIGVHLIWASIISFFTPFITDAIHFYYGFLFVGCLIFSIFFVYFFVPETKDLTLEEVNELWLEELPAWKTSNWVPYARRGGNYHSSQFNKSKKKRCIKFF